MITRRRLLQAAGASALLQGCQLNPAPAPPDSPLLRGRFPVGEARLGVTPGTTRPAVPDTLLTPDGNSLNSVDCARGTLRTVRPAAVDAAVYFPAVAEGTSPGQPIAARINFDQRFPLILYAHAKRKFLTCPENVPAGLDPSLSDPTLDFTRVGHMLSHIASWGFVVVAPDLGWLTSSDEGGEFDDGSGLANNSLPRAKILIALHDTIVANAAEWFGGQLTPALLGLFGHSNGANACIAARTRLPNTRILGLVAPAPDPSILLLAETNHNALVIGGTRDTNENAKPDAVYARFTGAKFLVKLGGANHLGYTELCDSSNRICMDQDPAGDISRLIQQETAAAYLVAAARAFMSGDAGMLSYLTDYRHTGAAAYLPSLQIRFE